MHKNFFLNNTFDESEVLSNMVGYLTRFASVNEQMETKSKENKRIKLTELLLQAAENLDWMNLIKEARLLDSILESASDPNVNLTDEEMLTNLKEAGWVFPEPKDEMEEEILEVRLD